MTWAFALIMRRETSTPRAVLYSALTTIGSFGSLALSSHPGMRSMGVLLTVALIWTTVCTVFILPALQVLLLPPSLPRTSRTVRQQST